MSFWKRPKAVANARINDNNTSYDKAELEVKDHHCHQLTEPDSCQQNVNAQPRSARPYSQQVQEEAEVSFSLNHSPTSHSDSTNARSGLPGNIQASKTGSGHSIPRKELPAGPPPVEVPARPNATQNILVISTEASSSAVTSTAPAIPASSSPHANSAHQCLHSQEMEHPQV